MKKIFLFLLIFGSAWPLSSYGSTAYNMLPHPGKSLNCQPSDTNPFKCLVCSVYFESKGSSPAARRDQVDTARAMLTRVVSKHYPNTMCKNVWMGSERGAAKKGCQFSWACDGKSDFIPGGKVLAEVVSSVQEAVYMGPSGFTHFFANWLSAPSWTSDCKTFAFDGRKQRIHKRSKHSFCNVGYLLLGDHVWARDVLTNLEEILADKGKTIPIPTPKPGTYSKSENELAEEELMSMEVLGALALSNGTTSYVAGKSPSPDREDQEVIDALDGVQIPVPSAKPND